MSTLTDKTLFEQGLSSDEIEGFRTYMRQPHLPPIWPEHFRGARIEAFDRGVDIAKMVLQHQRITAARRRVHRLKQRKTDGMMDVLSPQDFAGRRAEQLDALRFTLRMKDRLREPVSA